MRHIRRATRFYLVWARSGRPVRVGGHKTMDSKILKGLAAKGLRETVRARLKLSRSCRQAPSPRGLCLPQSAVSSALQEALHTEHRGSSLLRRSSSFQSGPGVAQRANELGDMAQDPLFTV